MIITGFVDTPNVDARVFLGSNVMRMHPSRLAPIERPLHVLGVRLMFPAFQEEDGTSTDWGVNVRIESAVNNKNKLFLEASAEWEDPQRWDSLFIEKAIAKLGIVSNFMSDRLMQFLRQPPFPEDLGEENE